MAVEDQTAMLTIRVMTAEQMRDLAKPKVKVVLCYTCDFW